MLISIQIFLVTVITIVTNTHGEQYDMIKSPTNDDQNYFNKRYIPKGNNIQFTNGVYPKNVNNLTKKVIGTNEPRTTQPVYNNPKMSTSKLNSYVSDSNYDDTNNEYLQREKRQFNYNNFRNPSQYGYYDPQYGFGLYDANNYGRGLNYYGSGDGYNYGREDYGYTNGLYSSPKEYYNYRQPDKNYQYSPQKVVPEHGDYYYSGSAKPSTAQYQYNYEKPYYDKYVNEKPYYDKYVNEKPYYDKYVNEKPYYDKYVNKHSLDKNKFINKLYNEIKPLLNKITPQEFLQRISTIANSCDNSCCNGQNCSPTKDEKGNCNCCNYNHNCYCGGNNCNCNQCCYNGNCCCYGGTGGSCYNTGGDCNKHAQDYLYERGVVVSKLTTPAVEKPPANNKSIQGTEKTFEGKPETKCNICDSCTNPPDDCRVVGDFKGHILLNKDGLLLCVDHFSMPYFNCNPYDENKPPCDE